ncbi:MAG: Fic family protein [Luteolibacter sp.]
MDPTDFETDQRANCQRQPEGYHAFLPPSLPPLLSIDWKLAALMSEADRAVAELSGAGRLLPNPHLLIRSYLRREAVLSSLIEDTYAEMDELLLFEVEPSVEPPRASIREVANHVQALETGLARLTEIPISSRLIRELHAILLSTVRGGENSKTPGEFRRSQNWIGRPGSNLKTATFVPPPPHELDQLLSDWENYLHAESDEPDLVKAALLHYQFEAIHPFLDGNGRIGRLLITLFFCARGTLSQPLLYLSAYFEKYRDEYYRHLLAISTRGDWQEWLIYFLTGVRDTARDALADTLAITDLHQNYRSILDTSKRPPTAAAGVLDSLFGSPMLSISVHAGRTGESYQSVSKAVAFWQKHGLVTEITNQRRHRIFAAPEILKLTRAKA